MNRSVWFHAVFSEDSNPDLAFLSPTDDSASLIPPTWHRLLHAHVARCWRNDSIAINRCHRVLLCRDFWFAVACCADRERRGTHTLTSVKRVLFAFPAAATSFRRIVKALRP